MTTTMDIFDVNDHKENYIALGQAVCALGVEDAIASIKKLEKTLNKFYNLLEEAETLREMYEDSKNKKEAIHRMKKILRFKSEWVPYFKSEYDRFVIHQGYLIDLDDFICSDWFNLLSQMELGREKVFNSITCRYSNVKCDDLLEYNNYFNSELNRIRDFIEVKAIDGWDKMYTA